MAENPKTRGLIFCKNEFPDIEQNSEDIAKWGYEIIFINNFVEVLEEKSEGVAQGNIELPILFLVSEADFLKAWDNDIVRIKHLKRKLTGIILIYDGESSLTERMHEVLVDELESPIKQKRLKRCLGNANTRIQLEHAKLNLRKELGRRTQQMQEMNRIGISLTLERNLKKLLENILTKARELTSADAGSIYLIDNEKPDKLRFAWAQNDTVQVPFNEFTLPIDNASIAGYAVLNSEIVNIPNVYEIPEACTYTHNSRWDESVNYKTISLLCVPFKKNNGEIIGCIQLINRKNTEILPANIAEFKNHICSFDAEDEALLSSLASQAAVALENSFLIESIQNLFDGFIKASVVAIESRDPSTSGHSERVADLSIKLANAVNETTTGSYAEVNFDDNQLKELKFAAILHDFGKVAIKENILVKQNKISDSQAEILKWRIELYKRILENHILNELIENSLMDSIPLDAKAFSEVQVAIQEKHSEFDELRDLIDQAAKPKPLQLELINRIADYKNIEFELTTGDSYPLITENDFDNLSIPRGSLNKTEKKEIESHVEHTYKFLQEIPWTKELKKIPEIAGGHHEKLNGEGYPKGKTEFEILTQSKIMAVADIFDALTATDRPYSNGLTIQQAIKILHDEAEKNQLDADLVKIFADVIIPSDSATKTSSTTVTNAKGTAHPTQNTADENTDSETISNPKTIIEAENHCDVSPVAETRVLTPETPELVPEVTYNYEQIDSDDSDDSLDLKKITTKLKQEKSDASNAIEKSDTKSSNNADNVDEI